MPKVFSDPVLITAQIGGTRAGSSVEDEATHDGNSVVAGVSIAGRTECVYSVALAFLRNTVYWCHKCRCP